MSRWCTIFEVDRGEREMKATEKATEIDEFITMLTGRDRKRVVALAGCIQCNDDALSFKDDLSRREYEISGLCQTCQDNFFGCDEE